MIQGQQVQTGPESRSLLKLHRQRRQTVSWGPCSRSARVMCGSLMRTGCETKQMRNKEIKYLLLLPLKQ